MPLKFGMTRAYRKRAGSQASAPLAGRMMVAALGLLLASCGGGGTSPAALPTLSIADAGISEGSSGGSTDLDFTVTLSAAFTSAVTVDYATSDGTALSAGDYTHTAATLTIPAGSLTGTITVVLNADTAFEPNETFTLTLSNPANATLATATATGTILNDDADGLNDTGITTWGDAGNNSLTVTQAPFPGQDADSGRDVTANDDSDGHAGFSFTKLDAAGQPLADQTAAYGTTPWACVLDQVTGLMWEVKTTADAGGLRDASHTYTWYNSTGVNDGGHPGAANGGTCTGSNCDTEAYVAAVNTAGLCGYTDWRLPDVEALGSLVDYSIASPGSTIDIGYFPNTQSNWYWSASPYAGAAAGAWYVLFSSGLDYSDLKSSNYYVRLVRGGQ